MPLNQKGMQVKTLKRGKRKGGFVGSASRIRTARSPKGPRDATMTVRPMSPDYRIP